MITVVNKNTHEPTERDIYIGRGSPLGNPYDWRGSPAAKFKCCCRASAIENYKKWLVAQMTNGNETVLDEMRKIYRMARDGDVYLVCFCEPQPCHGNIIASVIRHFLKKQKAK